MGYDLCIFKEEKNNRLLDLEDIEKLRKTFVVTIDELKDNKVIGFTVFNRLTEPAPEKEDDGFDFYSNSGFYFTSLASGGVNDGEYFENFITVAEEIATILNLKTYDPQFDEPIKEIDEVTTVPVINDTICWLEEIKKKPVESKYFIQYVFTTTDPVTLKPLILMMENNNLYCSKINVGESLDEVIKKEVPTLIGTNQFELKDFVKTDTAPDRYGTQIDRYDVFISVNHFNPKERQLPMKWKWNEF